MAFVGSSGLVGGAANTTTNPTYTPIGLNNLLVAVLTANQTTVSAFTITAGSSTGWANIQSSPGGATTSARSEIWWKIATAADLAGGNMPTWGTAAADMFGVVAEFNFHVLLDQSGNGGSGTTSPITATAGGTDKSPYNLIVGVCSERASSGTTGSFTDTVNGGSAGITVLGDNSGTSVVGHHHSIYAFVTTGASADTYQASWTFTSTHSSICIASFQGTYPFKPSRPLQAVNRGIR